MTEVRVPDDGGDEMIVHKHNGRMYPAFPIDVLQNMSKVKFKSDDVLVCAYPKSGTNWIWEVVRLLVSGEIDDNDVAKLFFMLERNPEETYVNEPSPRILNTHVLYEHLPEEAIAKKVKIIYVTRNVKDVTVSYYNFVKKVPHFKYDGSWENFLKPAVKGNFAYGSWIEYIKDWEKVKKTTDTRIFTLNYEDMKEDMFGVTKKLMDFIGVDRSDDFVRKVCRQTEFESMKKIKVDHKSWMTDVMYRKGQVGDWKNWFTVSQNEWIDSYYAEQMKDCTLKFRYTLE